MRIQSKRFELAAPFGWSVAKAFDSDATGQAAFNSSPHQIGCEEGERDRHVDVTDAALFADGHLFNISDRSGDDLIQPSTSPSDGIHKAPASLSALRSDIAPGCSVR